MIHSVHKLSPDVCMATVYSSHILYVSISKIQFKHFQGSLTKTYGTFDTFIITVKCMRLPLDLLQSLYVGTAFILPAIHFNFDSIF